MKAILIDSKNKEVKEVEFNKGEDNLQQMYALIDCCMVELIRLNETNDIWIDEEGMYSGNPTFMFGSAILYGNGLVLGNNNGGEIEEPTISIEYIKSKVKFNG